MKRMDAYDKAVLRYCVGAVAASAITGVVYVVAVAGLISEAMAMVAFILALAVVQLVVQLYFFLHISEGEKPRWRLHSLWFTAVMLAIVVVGSIWIMKNLDYNMGMTPEQMHQRMLEENKKGF